MCDPLEIIPPKPQQYAITNGREEIVLDTTIRAVSESYDLYCEKHLADVQEQVQRLHIRYVQVTAEENLPQLVRQTFPRRQ